MRGLNETGGRNRFRFQKLKTRIKQGQRRVDVVHKTKSHDFMFEKKGQLDPKPEAQGMDVVQGISQEVIPKSGCLFHDHVQGYLELNTSQAFQRLGGRSRAVCRGAF
ncbi:hypothetical protein Naga_100090g19 [Nannochloropsis gaditana]|uniref:Uncharacterized protein n=1 Tax=Nannochloropsis gaditana TaxID=72520 RepID=W7U309_9STRA|nr:hypothetical protein Naga_100090g19 [Nannochloropsis gaditana]